MIGMKFVNLCVKMANIRLFCSKIDERLKIKARSISKSLSLFGYLQVFGAQGSCFIARDNCVPYLLSLLVEIKPA